MPQPTGAAEQQRQRASIHQTGSTTVRVKEHVHAQIRELAQEMDESIQDVIEEAIEAFRRQRMIEAHNRAYAALRADPERWKAELAEREVWNEAAADGLEGA